MTALRRVLSEIVGAEHCTGMVILVIAGAILLLSFAVVVLKSANWASSRASARRGCCLEKQCGVCECELCETGMHKPGAFNREDVL
jgi:protein PsiE